MRYLDLPAARYRHGLSVRDRHLPEGRQLVTWMLQPSVKPAARVKVEPVTFGHVLAVLSAGLVLGLMAWIFVVGLFALGAANAS